MINKRPVDQNNYHTGHKLLNKIHNRSLLKFCTIYYMLLINTSQRDHMCVKNKKYIFVLSVKISTTGAIIQNKQASTHTHSFKRKRQQYRGDTVTVLQPV